MTPEEAAETLINGNISDFRAWAFATGIRTPWRLFYTLDYYIEMRPDHDHQKAIELFQRILTD